MSRCSHFSNRASKRLRFGCPSSDSWGFRNKLVERVPACEGVPERRFTANSSSILSRQKPHFAPRATEPAPGILANAAALQRAAVVELDLQYILLQIISRH